MGRVISEEDKAKILELYISGASWGELFKSFPQYNPQTIRTFIRHTNEYKERQRLRRAIDYVAPQYTKAEVLPLDNYIISSDWHIPFVSQEWMEKIIYASKKFQIKKIIIGGDFFDWYFFSFFDKRNPELRLGQEIKVGEMVLDELEKHFEKNLSYYRKS